MSGNRAKGQEIELLRICFYVIMISESCHETVDCKGVNLMVYEFIFQYQS